MERRNRAKLFDTGEEKAFFFQTAFGASFLCLTSGVFLSGLAILLGAGDVMVSFISVITNVCGVLILAFATFLQRFGSRKRLAVFFAVLSKLFTLFIVAIPAVVPARFRIAVFAAAVIAAFTLQAQATVALNNWMIAFIGEEKRGRYISLRETMALAVKVVLPVAGGWLIDGMREEYTGLLVLFLVALLAGIAETVILLRIPDSPAPRDPARRYRFPDAVGIPLADRAFMRFVLYIAAFYMTLNVADSFTTVYMMRYLELPYRLTTFYSMLISLPQVVLLGVWGKISDRRGHHFTLKSSIWFFAGETLFMAFAAESSHFVLIPAAFIMAAIGNAGFVISVFNRRYELMPETGRILYDNFFSAAVGLAVILGPVLGGLIKRLIESSGAAMGVMPFAGIRLLYVISTCGILLLQAVSVHATASKKRGRF